MTPRPLTSPRNQPFLAVSSVGNVVPSGGQDLPVGMRFWSQTRSYAPSDNAYSFVCVGDADMKLETE
jgi:hypothetical protein